VRFRLIGGGHSNLTYAAEDATGRCRVVRRPPLGSRGGNAHDMGREHRALTALFPTVVPVAEPLALCTDESVNDSSFYVMDYVAGTVVDNPAGALPPALRRRQ
jgi:aminoglycoside phosphotransferase (APT) family kinase protein